MAKNWNTCLPFAAEFADEAAIQLEDLKRGLEWSAAALVCCQGLTRR
jgi:hypothetical protein